MHEYLFEHQQALEEHDLQQYAPTCDRGATSSSATGSHPRWPGGSTVTWPGERSGVADTPPVYVNGVRHDGSYDVDSPGRAITAQPTGVPGGLR